MRLNHKLTHHHLHWPSTALRGLLFCFWDRPFLTKRDYRKFSGLSFSSSTAVLTASLSRIFASRTVYIVCSYRRSYRQIFGLSFSDRQLLPQHCHRLSADSPTFALQIFVRPWFVVWVSKSFTRRGSQISLCKKIPVTPRVTT